MSASQWLSLVTVLDWEYRSVPISGFSQQPTGAAGGGDGGGGDGGGGDGGGVGGDGMRSQSKGGKPHCSTHRCRLLVPACQRAVSKPSMLEPR